MNEIVGFRIEEKIYESVKSILYSGKRNEDNLPVIIKVQNSEYPDPKDLIRYQLEFSIGKSFDHTGIIKHIDIKKQNHNLAIITEDFGGVSIKEGFNLKRDGILSFLTYAIQIVDALGEVHKHKVIHKDINNRNIVLNLETRTIKLIDFGISSLIQRETKNPTSPEVIEGTLSYMSPEQTGRMNRSIDYRSDYYSLGISFYELLTNQLPFDSEDPMEIVHSHIAKNPPSPKEINSEIPEMVSKIIMKLMEKSADERYQTADGIKKDLMYSSSVLKGEIEYKDDFIAGLYDELKTFIVPGKLYGRENEIEKILDVYSNIKEGNRNLLMVSGYSGIGKTSAIREIHKPIVESKGYFIEGKFDQFKRNIPYDSIIQAFTNLIGQIISENTESVQTWKEKILSLSENNLSILSKLISDLELIIGKLETVETEINQNSNDIQIAFLKLIEVFAKKEHPLVLFLDDLQWADTATLKLISSAILSEEIESDISLLLIGAYRDNEVHLSHPLIMNLEKIKKESLDKEKLIEINLNPLNLNDIENYLSDSLRIPKSENISNLAKLILEKTNGNPFFIGEFIKNLCDSNLLYFDSKWTWDLERIRKSTVTENVVDLMIKNIKKLNPDSMEIINLSSYLGSVFNLNDLALVSNKSKQEVMSYLEVSLKENFISALDENYKFFLQTEFGERIQDINPKFKFVHDRIHQAAYFLTEESERNKTHLKIGRTLFHSKSIEEQEENLFDLVNHLNAGLELITPEEERFELLKLNIQVSEKAKDSSAYEVCLAYLLIAKSLHTEILWESEYDISYKVFSGLANSAYLCGKFDLAYESFEILRDHARTKIEKANAYNILIDLSTNAGKHLDVCKYGGEALALFGIEFSLETVKAGMVTEMKSIRTALKDKKPNDLLDLPKMTDPEMICVMDILTSLHASVFFTDKIAGTFISFKMVSLSLQYGNAKQSSMGYAMYGASQVALGESKLGMEFANVAMTINERFQNKQFIPKLAFVHGATINHWVNHLLTNVEIYDNGIEAGLESGDMIFAGFLYAHRIVNRHFAGVNLSETIEEGEKNSESPYVARSPEMLSILKTARQVALCLTGKTNSSLDFSDENFDDKKYRLELEKVQLTSSLLFYLISKIMIHLIFGLPEKNIELVLECEKYVGLSAGFFIISEVVFYSSLTYLGIYDSSDETKQKEILSLVGKNQKKLNRWVESCPENFLHKYNLIEAEIARIEKRELDAMKFYELAVENATKYGFTHHIALGNEMAGKFYLNLGNKKIAKLYLTDSRYAYSTWGAVTKVEDLEAKYPEFLSKNIEQKSKITSGSTVQLTTTSTTQGSNSFLDVSTIIKASQAISSEIRITNLLEKMIQISIENAGAERGVLLLEREGHFSIEADGKTGQEEIAVLKTTFLEDAESILPISLVNYVIRSKQAIVLENGIKDTRFNKDKYISNFKIKSILCMPIINQGKLIGILYLENNLITNAFTFDRLELLKVLAGQSSISIENARLYSDMTELNKAYSKFVPKEFLEFLGKKNITAISLGDQVEKEMTVLFSDIRSFTTISEKMTANENFDFINSYLKQIGPVIRNNFGFIDKYIGDAIMALFPTHADDALKAAIDMHKELRIYNKVRLKKGYDPISIGVGMHTGTLMLGTIGESERMEGTVISDNVNLASRIEGLTKYYGANILISDSTLYKLKDKSTYHYRLLDRVKVKGKKLPVSIIEILDGQPDFVIELFMNTRIDFEKAVSAYLEKNFDKANFLFRKILEQNANDKAAKIYLQRSEYFGIHGVPIDWEGVEIMDSK